MHGTWKEPQADIDFESHQAGVKAIEEYQYKYHAKWYETSTY